MHHTNWKELPNGNFYKFRDALGSRGCIDVLCGVSDSNYGEELAIIRWKDLHSGDTSYCVERVRTHEESEAGSDYWVPFTDDQKKTVFYDKIRDAKRFCHDWMNHINQKALSC